MRVCLPDVSSRLKAILTSDLSGDTRLVEVIIYPFLRPRAQNGQLRSDTMIRQVDGLQTNSKDIWRIEIHFFQLRKCDAFCFTRW